MHQLVGLLRAVDDTAASDREPRPGLDNLASLESDERPIVRHRRVGTPFDVPGTAQLSLFRIAQEAVANVRRHANAASAEVVLRYVAETGETERAVEVEVIDDGTSRVAGSGGTGGFGLRGVRERTDMHGGVCEIGPRPQGGFRVRVRIPAGEDW
jgi:signal transduction histidine kinase